MRKEQGTVGDGLAPSRVGETALADSLDHKGRSRGTGPTPADGWLRTTPLAVFFFLGRMVKSLVSNFANVAASAAGLVILVKQHVGLAAVAVVIGLVVLVALAVLRYWFFQFRVAESGVLIRQGVLRKTQLDIRFDRIQGISTEQSLIYRLLGLVTVRFTTAGAAGDEGHLPAVTPEFVARLRDRVEAEPVMPEVPGVGSGEILLRLDGGEVARVGLTDPRVLQFALLGTALMPVFGKAFDEPYELVAQLAARSWAALADLGPLFAVLTVAALFVAIVLVLLLASVVVAVLRYHGYELSQDGSTFRASSGLLTRKDVTVEAGKLQQLIVRQGLVMGWMHRQRLQAFPAGGIADIATDGTQKLTVPLAGDRTVENLRERVFGSEAPRISVLPCDRRFAAVSPYAIWPPVLWFGVAPAVAASLLLASIFPSVGLWCLGWVVVVGLVAWQRWRRRAYLHDDDALVCRSGFLGYRVDALLFRKVQQVGVSQSPLQRRRGLAALHVHLATGSVTLAFIEHRTARRLRDYILFKTESSRLAWH